MRYLRPQPILLGPRNAPQAARRGFFAPCDGPSPRKSRAGERGQALLEMAFVVPLLLTLVMGIIVFGIALNTYVTLTNSATMGAQALATSRGQSTDPCATAVSAFEAAAPNLAPASLSFSFAFNGGAASAETSCSSQTLVQGQNAQMTVTYPCNLTVVGVNLAPSCTLTAQTAEVIQ